MPKQPKPAPNPIERVSPNDRRLPPALMLSEPCDAEVLPDGRVVPLLLPPAVRAMLFPDLADAPSPIGVEDVPESAPAPQEIAYGPVAEETEPADAPQDAPETTDVPPAPAVEEL